MIGFPVHSD